ncbi:MAG TPA: hypothetical protein VGJ64_06505 [Gemmatimonadaceae bacterium]
MKVERTSESECTGAERAQPAHAKAPLPVARTRYPYALPVARCPLRVTGIGKRVRVAGTGSG